MNGAEPAVQLSLWRDTGGGVSWTLRESRRSRRLSLRVHHGGEVEVVAPPGTARPVLLAFLQRHQQWIDRRRALTQRNARPVEPFPPRTLQFSALHETWYVHLSGGPGPLRAQAIADSAAGGVLRISGHGGPLALRRCLLRWLYAHAHCAFARLLLPLAAATGHRFKRIQIRRQRSRWGSCSARGTISLNCALLFQRPEVVRYLLIHELVHTRHMNHSRSYWAAVGQLEPDYRRLDRQLLEGWSRVPTWLQDAPGGV